MFLKLGRAGTFDCRHHSLQCFLGIDDTDSSLGFCTTYLGYRIVLELMKEGCLVNGYPRLVRLNPNVPFKTRGNAAVSLPFEAEDAQTAFKSICSIATTLSDVRNGANTGIVFLNDPSLLPLFKEIYQSALNGLLNKEKIKRLLRDRGVLTYELGNGMGIVGASASLGFDKSYDHTYELIAYRREESWGRLRRIDADSVVAMDQQTFPHTFNNYDYEKRKPLITPHGPDPVLLGIRGDSPHVLLRAYGMVEHSEQVEGRMIYVSNQCTDAHLESSLGYPLKAYSSGSIEGVVDSVNVDAGGHLYLTMYSGRRKVRAAVYEPTGNLQRAARHLLRGDRVIISGGVRRPSNRHAKIVNIERLQVLSLAPVTKASNPVCDRCNLRMKSEGRGKGFQCEKCGRLAPPTRRKIRTVGRALQPGYYLPSPRANRHLTKPLIRYGLSSAGDSFPLVEGWLGRSAPIPLLGLARNL